jgi:hypothetical protein
VSPLRIGARDIDVSNYPATAAGLSRHIRFACTFESQGSGTANIKLVDITDSADITGAASTTTSQAATTFTSSDLTVGSSAGNIRSDAVKQYELQLWMTGGGANDRVACTSARLLITYS